MRDENIQFLQRFFSLSLSLFSQKEGVCDDDSSGFVDSRIALRLTTLSFLSFSLFLRTQQNASSSSSASSPKRGEAVDDAKYAVPVLVTSSSSSSYLSSDRRTTERVYRNAAHKDHLLRGFPFPNDECKTLGDIWESAFKKYPNKAFLG